MRLEAAKTRKKRPGQMSVRSGWTIASGVALALAALAAAILVSLLHLRERIFAQIANRDGQMMGAVAAVQFAEDKANDESITSLEDPSEQIQLALKISSRLHSVLGVRLFSADGKFLTAFPQYITETNLPQADLQALQALQPVSHFVPKAQMDEQDLLAGTNTEAVPLLVVNVPLREETTNRLDGIAQFLVYGSEIAREYAVLDRHLATQGILVFLISGSIVTAGLLLAFRRVEKANRLLAQRTGNLLKANRELALAAKTSAIGAVTSHLIHGLKNPLSGLRTFVQDRATAPDAALEDEWQLAAATTQRMQSLIDRVVRVLQEQQTATDYEITFAELIEILSSKLRPLAESAGVNYRADADLAGSMSNRQADLLLLILENLVQNAIEATPPGKRVNLRVFCDGSRAVMEIQDEGPGMPPDLLEKLFAPCPSAKKGGSGIGLAISRQLAAHLGATLDLKQTSAAGCCFRIVLPLAAAAEPDPEDSRVAAIARGESTEASIGALAKKSNP